MTPAAGLPQGEQKREAVMIENFGETLAVLLLILTLFALLQPRTGR